MSKLFLALALVLGGGTRANSQESRKALAFVNVTIVPMDFERVEEDQTVIVREGIITEISPSSQIKVPDMALVVDGRGRYLMPGLTDMHVHLDDEDPAGLALFVANGVTTVRNMWGNPEILRWRARVQSGDLIGPTIYTAGPITDGAPPTWPGSTVVTTPEQVRSEVTAQKQAGYDGVKVLDNLLPEVYEAILTTAAEQGLPVYGHVPWRVGLTDVLDGGQKSVEHMIDWMHALLPNDSPVRETLLEALADRQKMSLKSYMIQPFRSVDNAKIPELVARAAASDVWFCPTLVLPHNLASTADEFRALRSRSTMRLVAPSNWPYWDRMETMVTSEQGDPAVMKEALRTMLSSVRALHDAGVRLLVGTDTPNPFVVPGFSVHAELQNFVDAGLTPYEALRAATADAAEFLGALEKFGTVAVGRRADLILLEGNPLENVAEAKTRVGVSVGGRWFTEKELQLLLDELADEYREPKLRSDSLIRPHAGSTEHESKCEGDRITTG